MATSAVKVYGWAISPFVSRALLALEEAGVDYELVPMSRQAGDHHRPEHLARNPFGKVPVLEDGDLTLFAQARAARHRNLEQRRHWWTCGLRWRPTTEPVSDRHRGRVHLHACSLAVNATRAVVGENVEKLKKVLEVYEARPKQVQVPRLGDFLSLADLSHFTIMHCFMATEYAALVEVLPRVGAWWRASRHAPVPRRWRSSCRLVRPGHPRNMSDVEAE
ncbi:unnamed protein product [Miscanthus lutarioriparius]|uniref:glutathione transferase n=1 Tax=Miscanthus lutarioriparius TaxID=422564 RepID=A0A811RSH3_9POAL|nr:unnamed protein product [Miscanthus lutarioriparius]